MKTTINIMLADDDEDDHFIFKMALKELSQSTKLVSIYDGEALMHHLSENLNDNPDVIFLDIHMPGKNGSECLKEIKHNKYLNNIPIVMYSTTITKDSFELFYKNDDFYCICKPTDTKKLIKF